MPVPPQTSDKSTVLPVGFVQTAQTSQTLAQPPYKVRNVNVLNSTFDYTISNFLLNSGILSEYNKMLLYQFPDPRYGGFNYYNLDRNKPPYPPSNEKNISKYRRPRWEYYQEK